MTRPTLLDTGPLVALLNARDRFHGWAADTLANLPQPLLTVEAVIAEACYLLRHDPRGPSAVLKLVGRGLLMPSLRIEDEAEQVDRLMRRYRNVPMDLADACLVRLASLHRSARVMTIDRDFAIYRLPDRRVIPTLMPPA